MSNIYIQEPPTNGKVLLITSAGDLDIELWSKEAPKACRNFVQLCMEGYYNGTVFHRVVQDFIVQGGDPTGTGMGGESIYGKPFKDEIHTRLRFVRRGLVAMANSGPNDNGSQFFITMAQTPELQNKHTIFGKITGNTVYNIGKLQEVEVDQHDRPYHPHKIKSTHILSNPFDDIVPRTSAEERKSKDSKEEKVKSKSKATKNYKLLSFGDEAEEQEEEVELVSKDSKGKGKSSHDLIDDPTLSTETTEIDSEEVRQRLAQPPKEKKARSPVPEKGDEDKKISRTEELRQEAKRLKRDLRGVKSQKTHSEEDPVKEDAEEKNEVIAAYKAERQKYKKAKVKKGSGREEATLALLAKFQSKLESVKKISGNYSEEEEEAGPEGEAETEASGDVSWMTHKLIFEDDEKKRKVIDANVQELDRYEIYDPRNPLTKRRRENSKQTMKEKKKHT